MKAIFWDAIENRVRFGWRVLGSLLLALTSIVIISTLLHPLVSSGVNPGVTLNTPPGLFRMSMLGFVSVSLSVWAASRWLDKRPVRDMGLRLDRSWWLDCAFGLLLGAVLITAVFLAEFAAGWLTVEGKLNSYRGLALGWAFLQSVATFIFVGIYEELFFRMYLLTNIAEWFTRSTRMAPRQATVYAALVSSLIFGLTHSLNPGSTALSTLNITIGSFFLLAAGFLLTGELALPIGVHITFNLFQGSVFGFGVSGFEARSTTLLSIEQGGPTWLTGGSFGPEAGLLGLLAMVLGGVLIVGWVKYRRGAIILCTSIAEYSSTDTRNGLLEPGP